MERTCTKMHIKRLPYSDHNTFSERFKVHLIINTSINNTNIKH